MKLSKTQTFYSVENTCAGQVRRKKSLISWLQCRCVFIQAWINTHSYTRAITHKEAHADTRVVLRTYTLAHSIRTSYTRISQRPLVHTRQYTRGLFHSPAGDKTARPLQLTTSINNFSMFDLKGQRRHRSMWLATTTRRPLLLTSLGCLLMTCLFWRECLATASLTGPWRLETKMWRVGRHQHTTLQFVKQL